MLAELEVRKMQFLFIWREQNQALMNAQCFGQFSGDIKVRAEGRFRHLKSPSPHSL